MAEVQRIPIDTTGKQLLLVRGLTEEAGQRLLDAIDKLLTEESASVLFWSVEPNVEWEFIKVEQNDE